LTDEVLYPVVLAVGAGAPQGKAKICQSEAELGLVHDTVAELEVLFEAIKANGLGQVAGGIHVTSATQPGLFITLSLLKRNVKQPLGLEE
jgi:hypothetical protein